MEFILHQPCWKEGILNWLTYPLNLSFNISYCCFPADMTMHFTALLTLPAVRASSSYQPPACPSHGSALTTWGRNSESTSGHRRCRTGSSGSYPYECKSSSLKLHYNPTSSTKRNHIFLCDVLMFHYFAVVGCSIHWLLFQRILCFVP